MCGARKWTAPWTVITDELDDLSEHADDLGEDLTIIEGGAGGVDKIAKMWAISHARDGVRHHGFKADWARFGVAAGPIRNQAMIDEGKPDRVLAFPGGVGTKDMVSKAVARGIPVSDPEGVWF